jgi:SAM-dependent methyltransferase
MDYYEEKTYGDRVAGVYDQWYSDFEAAAISTLADLAGKGKALELGIGTGRIAIPLLKAGVNVQGIDISESMVAKLKAKPGGDKIPVTFGNFVDVEVGGKYSLIYIVFNTFFSPLTQEEQVRCFRNVASHLEAGGVFVIEAFVPDMARFIAGQTTRVIKLGDNELQIDASLVEMDKQLISSQHVIITDHGTRFYPVKIRYAWPSEMDLMAQLSALQLRERWSNWEKAYFNAQSKMHISIYEHEKK